MCLLDLPEHILDDIFQHLNQGALLNLKVSCRFLEHISNDYLLKNIYFYNDMCQKIPLENTYFKLQYTFIPLSKLPSFIGFLKTAPNAIHLIESVIIDSDLDSFLFDFIFSLLNEKDNHIAEIKFYNTDIDLLQILSLNNGCLHSKLYPLYENDEIDDSNSNSYSHFSQLNYPVNIIDNYSSSLNLSSIQINSCFETDILAELDLKKLELNIQNINVNMILKPYFIEKISKSLNCLNILNSISSNYFSAGMSRLLKNSELTDSVFFNNLDTLSIFISDDDYSSNLITILGLDLSNIRNLEIKFKRTRFEDSTANNLEIIKLLNSKIDLNKLEKFSLINMNNINMLTDNIFKNEIYDDSNLCFALLNNSHIFNGDINNITYLNVCLNTFLTVVDISQNGYDTNEVFVVDQKYINRKRQLFDKIFKFKNLETLIIPDFLFNWLSFLEEGLDFNQKYLKNYSDSCANFVVIIKRLYRRFKGFENISALDITDYPIYTAGDEIDLIPYLNELVPIFLIFAERLPFLKLLNLGGAFINIQRQCDGSIERLNGIYDSWVFTDFPIGK